MKKGSTLKNEPKDKEEFVLYIKNWIDEQINPCREFTSLYIQGDKLKNLEPELKQIFSFRLNARLIQFIKIHARLTLNLYCYYGNDPYDNVKYYDIAQQIADDHLKIFLDDIKKEGIKEILIKAREGNKRAILKLVRWEKTAVSLNFVVEEIAKASCCGNKDFFEQLANAIKQKVTDERKKRNQNYVLYLSYLIPLFKTRNSLNERQIWKKIITEKYNGLSLSDYFQVSLFKGDDVSSLVDIDYFVKFLKRNKITA